MRWRPSTHFQRGHLSERCGLAELGKFGEGEAVVFKRNTADVQRQAHRLGAATVEVEIVQLEWGMVSPVNVSIRMHTVRVHGWRPS